MKSDRISREIHTSALPEAFKNIVHSREHSYGPTVDFTKLIDLFEQGSHRRITAVFNGVVNNACNNNSCRFFNQPWWDRIVAWRAFLESPKNFSGLKANFLTKAMFLVTNFLCFLVQTNSAGRPFPQ